MTSKRWDETWHRLQLWTNGQGPSERLAAQVLLADGYQDLDPSHPLGGPDGAKDAIATKDGRRWVMAVYFPRGSVTLAQIKSKVQQDYAGVLANGAHGLVFVCNQELTLSEREDVERSVSGPLTLYHLERVTAVLDQPRMGPVRRQFSLEDETGYRLEALQTGGDTYAYAMLYDFDLTQNIARNLAVIRQGEFPLYDLRFRVHDLERSADIYRWPNAELNSPAEVLRVRWKLPDRVYYRIFFHARNGSWHQDLQLRKSVTDDCWLAATRVQGLQQAANFQHLDHEYASRFGQPVWRT